MLRVEKEPVDLLIVLGLVGEPDLSHHIELLSSLLRVFPVLGHHLELERHLGYSIKCMLPSVLVELVLVQDPPVIILVSLRGWSSLLLLLWSLFISFLGGGLTLDGRQEARVVFLLLLGHLVLLLLFSLARGSFELPSGVRWSGQSNIEWRGFWLGVIGFLGDAE